MRPAEDPDLRVDDEVETDILILGAGLTGLAAATTLGDRATVLERDERPGGLVRTDCVEGYWFDRVIHLLHFRDDATEARVKALLGPDLAPCPPESFVETRAGVARFPLQLHLAGLQPEARLACLRDFAAAARSHGDTPREFADFLLQSFGRELCELFFFPYNRKMWRRPLDSLAPSEFQWNIERPDLDRVTKGAFDPEHRAPGYNSNGWYPRPAPAAPVRGMEVLSRALAARVRDLRLGHEVVAIDPERRRVIARAGERLHGFRYRDGCLSTLPLPVLTRRARGVPDDLVQAVARLRHNRVISVGLAVAGARPRLGHWRYYPDESLCFTRLVFLHEFDPAAAPPEGWPLLAEITQRAEDPAPSPRAVVAQVTEQVRGLGILESSSRVIASHVMRADPAYVVFGLDDLPVIHAARRYFEERGVTTLGRYGRWEYSSMAQAMRDGFAWGDARTAGSGETSRALRAAGGCA